MCADPTQSEGTKLTSIHDGQHGRRPIALIQGSKRDLIPPLKFLAYISDNLILQVNKELKQGFISGSDAFIDKMLQGGIKGMLDCEGRLQVILTQDGRLPEVSEQK